MKFLPTLTATIQLLCALTNVTAFANNGHNSIRISRRLDLRGITSDTAENDATTVISAATATATATITPKTTESTTTATITNNNNENPCLSTLIDKILRGNATAASTAVDILARVRGTDLMDTYLNDILPPPKEHFPLWTRLPLTKFSRRARQLRLRKLLDLSTPAIENDNVDDATTNKGSSTRQSRQVAEVNDDEESRNRRARRALFVLLRTMSNNSEYKGISEMLTAAQRDAKVGNIISAEEMRKRTPSELETPKYRVMATRKNGLEIRRYEQFSVCSVTMKELSSITTGGSDKESVARLSNPQLSGATSFGALAGYLFGKNEESKAMKMTTPVFTEGYGDSKKMSFVLPSEYWADGSVVEAPKPLLDSAVKVSSVGGCDRAVLAFGGFARKADVALRSEKLREMVAMDEEWMVDGEAEVTLAQYNDPFTPPWKRRNEVSVPVVLKG